MRRFSATLAITLAMHATISAQAPDPEPPLSIRSSAGIERLADTWVGRGPDYRVEFAARQIRFVPALGPTAPREYPFDIACSGYGRAPEWFDVERTSQPIVDADARRVTYPHRGISERYDVQPDGVAQSFVFEALPAGSGDLVVRLAVSTALTAAPAEDAVEFHSESHGGVRVHGVTGIDANGATVRGSMRWDETTESIDLILPAEFVDRAALPLLVDPLIGTVTNVTPTSTAFDLAPDVAYSPVRGLYLVVFTQFFSISASAVVGQRVDAVSRSLVGGPQTIATIGASGPRPVVAYVRWADDFVVMWSGAMRVVPSSASASLGPITTITSDVESHDISGSATNSSAHDYCVIVWSRTGTVRTQSFRIQSNDVVVSTGTPTSLTAATTSQLFVSDAMCSIANSGGASHQRGIVWQRTISGLSPGFLFAVVETVGTALAPVVRHTHSISALSGETLAGARCDGDGSRWVVAFTRSAGIFPPSTSVHAASYRIEGGRLRSSRTAVVAGDPTVNEIEPAVGHLGQSALIAYSVPPSSSSPNAVRLASADAVDCGPCEPTVTAWSSSFDNRKPAIATVASSSAGSTSRDAIVVFEAYGSTNTDIFARFYSATSHGVAVDIGGGCGAGGTAHAACPRIPNAGFVHTLRDAAPSRTAVLMLGVDVWDATCGACRIVPRLLHGSALQVTTTDSIGAASIAMPLPNVPALRGLTFLEQWIVVASAPVCAAAGFDVSNALRVTIE